MVLEEEGETLKFHFGGILCVLWEEVKKCFVKKEISFQLCYYLNNPHIHNRCFTASINMTSPFISVNVFILYNSLSVKFNSPLNVLLSTPSNTQ